MTLEGEYYAIFRVAANHCENCRNPHDIGRRILRKNLSCKGFNGESQSSWHWKANITRPPYHERLQRQMSQSSWHWKANITGEGDSVTAPLEEGRNPHDIGRRILPNYDPKYKEERNESQSSWHWKANITLWVRPHARNARCRNPHDIGRRILPDYFNLKGAAKDSRNPHDIGRRILQEVHQHKITYR